MYLLTTSHVKQFIVCGPVAVGSGVKRRTRALSVSMSAHKLKNRPLFADTVNGLDPSERNLKRKTNHINGGGLA